MSGQAWSWEQALLDGTLSETQMEALEAIVDSGEAETLLAAARRLDYESTHYIGTEPGTQGF
jgi:hypothetical protein